ncbi:uncharacterized protein LOC110451980 [Mizuhopecten yessoensis]|uniref:DNA-binding protein RFX5 n=1 Tax=Mizuhopecten yessoensis TaxID=6573 RepID=A0A210QKP3_MIZYE|nr:uncharacterized protein LOC110451980 [Mizuhopecten yessoensis]OWF49323.1 DNA-binding protein RFX5 [Mizuhopecten yessoensis]
MNQHYIVSENVRFDVANNNKGESLKNARIGNLAILTSDVIPARANVYIPENDRSELINGDTRCGRESHPKGRYSNIEEGLESSVSNEAKDRINRIVGDVKSLSDVEKLLLYLRLPTGDTSKDLRQTPTSCLQTSNRTEQAQAYTWIRSHLEEDVEICLPKQEVYDDYRVYCENHGIRPLSTADFGKLMKCVFPNVKPRRLGQRGQSRYCYGGLRKKLDIEAPGLPDLEISPHKQQDTGSEDDELYAASCQLVCEWAQKLLEQNFPSVRELAEHLVSHLYVNSKSVSAFTVVAGMQDTGIQNMKVSSMFSNTTGGDRHRETQLQLQRKLHEREQLREHKKKLQMQKEENEQKAKEAQDRMTPSLASPTLLRALTSPARRIFDKKDEDSGLFRNKSILSGNTGKSKQPVVDSLRSKSSLGKEKVIQKQEKTCQDMDVDGSRSPAKSQGQTNDQLRVEAMDTGNDAPIHLASPNPLDGKEHTDMKKIFTKLKSSPDDSRKLCEVGREEWNISLMGRVHSAHQMRDTWNLGEESPTRTFHTIMKPAAVSQHRPHKSESDIQRVKVTGMTEESREISLSPDVVDEKITEQSPIDVSHEIIPNFDVMETVEITGNSDECLHLSVSSVSTSVSSSVSSSSVSSRSAFVPFSQMSTRKESDMLSMKIPSSTSSQISSIVSQTDVHPKTNVSVSSSESVQSNMSSNIPQFPSIPSHESQIFASVEGTVKPPGSLSLNLNSPGSNPVSYPTCTTVGLLGAMSTASDIPTSQALPQTSPSTPKKTKSRFTPIRPKASPSKTVSNILKEKSAENSIYNKSKPVATLLKEKRAREAEVLAQSQINGGVTLSPGGINQASSGVQIQNIQNITASTLPKSLELNKPGEFFIILNPVSKMSVVSPVSTVTQSLLSNSATMTTSSRGKSEMSRGQRSANPSRSRTNSSSESEIESIFPMGKESWGVTSDSAEESFTDLNMDETPSKLVKIDCDQGVSSRPGSRCSVDRETPSFGRKRKFYTCGNVSYHKRINSTDDTDDEVVIIEQKENDKDSRRAKSCSLDQQDQDEIMSPVNKENLNNTIDSIHCPDISILEIDALSDSGLDSEQLQLLSDSKTPKSIPQTHSAAVGVNSLLLRHSQRELLKQKEVLDERMRSYWSKESKVTTFNKSDVVNIQVHSELPQDVADFITDALTGIANTSINENEDTNKKGNGEIEMQHSRPQSLSREKKANGPRITNTVTSRNFLQPIVTSPLMAMSMKTQRRKDSVQDNGQEKGQNQEISTKTSVTMSNFASPQRPVRRQRTPSIERLLGPTVTPDRHVQLQSPLDQGLTGHSDKVNQYMSEQGKATTPTSFASPVHPVMQRKREMSVDRISNQTPFSDAGYGSIGASPIQTSTPVSGLGGICDITLNSTSSAGFLMSRPDSVQSLPSDTVMQSPVPPFSPRNYTSTPLTVRSPCSTQNSNPLQSPLGMGPPTRAFMPIQSSSTQKLETTVTLIKPTVTMASGNGGEAKEILKDLIGIGSIQPEQRQTRPPPSYKVAVQALTYLQAENTESSGAFNRPPSGPIDFPMTDLVSPTKHQSVIGMMGKNNEALPDLSLQLNHGTDPGQPDKSIANAYPCSFQLALMSQKSREDGKEAASGSTLYRSGQKGTTSVSSGTLMLNTTASQSSDGQATGQYTEPMVLGKSPLHMLEGPRSDRFPEKMVFGQSSLQQPEGSRAGQYMDAMVSGRPAPQHPNSDGHRIGQFEGGSVQGVLSKVSKRPTSQQSDHSTRNLFSPEIQGRDFMSGGVMVQNSKERDIESILNILKEPNQPSKHAEKGKQGGIVMKVQTVLPNANYKGNAPNVNLTTNPRISEKLRPYVMDKVMTSVMDDVEFSARRNLMPDLMEEPSSTEINEEELMSTLEDLRSVDEKYFVQDDFNSKRL